uniref:DNA replication complex GINS protein PSF3 N-terminal domain-containing protein n=1 Tax=Canis lupus dingo TaxID=286419 RepID=A0A8C0KB31_CANLU
MSEAYFRVESGALGPEENFLSLDDILMSHEKLPVRTETAMPRLGAFLLERSGGAETDHAIPQVSLRARWSGTIFETSFYCLFDICRIMLVSWFFILDKKCPLH